MNGAAKTGMTKYWQPSMMTIKMMPPSKVPRARSLPRIR